jgi:hypothetical protein
MSRNSALAAAVADDPQSTPGPLQTDVDKTKNDLAGYLTARAMVSSYVAGVQKVTLNDIKFDKLPPDIQSKLPADPAELLATLQGQLKTAQDNALNWSNNIEPALTDIPQAIINFNSKFQSAASSILTWVTQLANGDDSNKAVLLQTLQWLIAQIDAQTKSIDAEMTLIKAFNTQLVTDHGNFSSANSAFGILYTYEEASIKNLTQAIKGLQDALDAENKAITASAIAAGVGGALMIAGGIGLATAETGVGIVVAGICIIVGLAAAIAGIVELVKAINEKVATQNNINNDQTAVSLLSLQATALQSTEAFLSKLVDLSENAISAVQVILDTWGTLRAKIVAVHDDLASAEGPDLGTIAATFDVATAQTQWGQLQDFAEKMQNYVQQNFEQGVQDLANGGKVTPLTFKTAS